MSKTISNMVDEYPFILILFSSGALYTLDYSPPPPPQIRSYKKVLVPLRWPLGPMKPGNIISWDNSAASQVHSPCRCLTQGTQVQQPPRCISAGAGGWGEATLSACARASQKDEPWKRKPAQNGLQALPPLTASIEANSLLGSFGLRPGR